MNHIEKTTRPLVRHICGYCAPGYLKLASAVNPAKTDWCAKCEHRAEGIDREVIKSGWRGLTILEGTTK
jgi:hypothetical protein